MLCVCVPPSLPLPLISSPFRGPATSTARCALQEAQRSINEGRSTPRPRRHSATTTTTVSPSLARAGPTAAEGSAEGPAVRADSGEEGDGSSVRPAVVTLDTLMASRSSAGDSDVAAAGPWPQGSGDAPGPSGDASRDEATGSGSATERATGTADGSDWDPSGSGSSDGDDEDEDEGMEDPSWYVF